MADVNVQVRFSPDAMALVRQLAEEAVQRAVSITVSRLRELARKYTPIDTGRLIDSFDIGSTPRSIVMKWGGSTLGKFDYASVADTGRPGGVPIVAKTSRGLIFKNKAGQWVRKRQVVQGAVQGDFFAEAMKFEAKMILVEELKKELEVTLAP